MSVSGKSPKTPSEQSSAPPRSAVILLLKDMASTTWRMFVPTIGLAVLGAWVDRLYDTAPWFAISGVLVGAGIAALLIARQLSKVN